MSSLYYFKFNIIYIFSENKKIIVDPRQLRLKLSDMGKFQLHSPVTPVG